MLPRERGAGRLLIAFFSGGDLNAVEGHSSIAEDLASPFDEVFHFTRLGEAVFWMTLVCGVFC